MTHAVGYGALALMLIISGAGLRQMGHWRQRAVISHLQLLAMRHTNLKAEHDALDRATAFGRSLPGVGQLQASVGAQRAEATYWQRDYGALRLTRDASGALVEQDPDILLLAANAAYRRISIAGADRDTAERLQAVVGQYADVIKQAPTSIDAAYNYEFAAKTRDLLLRSRRSNDGRKAVRPGPSVQTILGRPGAPTVPTDMGKFKIIIPERPDERNQAPQSGSGGLKVRKG